MIAAIGSALTSIIGWIGEIVDALVTGGSTPGALNALLPLFALGVAVTIVMLGIRVIKGFTYGA